MGWVFLFLYVNMITTYVTTYISYLYFMRVLVCTDTSYIYLLWLQAKLLFDEVPLGTALSTILPATTYL